VDGNISSATLGQVVSAAPPRLLQIGLEVIFDVVDELVGGFNHPFTLTLKTADLPSLDPPNQISSLTGGRSCLAMAKPPLITGGSEQSLMANFRSSPSFPWTIRRMRFRDEART
jgi:hypothetical protein